MRIIVKIIVFIILNSLIISCAQDVKTVDRTLSNRIKKSNLKGSWYMLDMVTYVPSTTEATFIGECSALEKIVWKIEEKYLFAYRSYPRVKGADDVDRVFDYTDPDYHENPVAAYPVIKHFDIKREYSPATGEQTNVIVENDYDRLWHERDYVRVDWSKNEITNFNFISDWIPYDIEASYTIDQDRNEDRSIYLEYEKENLIYFDLPRKLLLEPDLWGCAYSWWGWGYEDCTSAEIEIVTSFAKTGDISKYESLQYDDKQMTRFGFFRSERYAFDPQRGVTETNRIKLINRHNFWKESFKKNADGTYYRNEQGILVPIPMKNREVKTVPYYKSVTFPIDDKIDIAAKDSVKQWNNAAKLAISLAKETSTDSIPDLYVLCDNPVSSDNDTACGEIGFSPRPGDLRYNSFYWVESEQLYGLLGYGPPLSDPETGEIISGRAHVYGSGVNWYASYGLDIIRFINGDLAANDLIYGNHVRDDILKRLSESFDNNMISKALLNVPLKKEKIRDNRKMTSREEYKRNIKYFDRNVAKNKLNKAKDAGFSAFLGGEEYNKALLTKLNQPFNQLSPNKADIYNSTNWLNPTNIKEIKNIRFKNIAKGLDYFDLVDLDVLGLAKKYEGRTDYEEIWSELRTEIFKATAIHEIGHSIGLRHNFQGTYDSLNYLDQYWDLRKENLYEPQSIYDLYEMSTLTQNQIDGRMREYQYSSIMDYGLTFNTDIHGLGRYDIAAIVYGYSAGTVAVKIAEANNNCEGIGEIKDPDDSTMCLVKNLGYIEVFKKRLNELGKAGEILTSQDDNGFSFDDPTSPIIPYLERWHYSTVMLSFPAFEDAFSREWIPMKSFLESREKDEDKKYVRVPYLFCSDEWESALLSCRVFDAGADPFEIVRNVVRDYRSYYYFTNFKRNRLGWDMFDALFRNYFRTFLPLSDYYQNWYLSPEGADDVMDSYYWLSVTTGLNLISEALTTPPYGTYCTGKNGNLFHLSEEPGQGPRDASDYFLSAYCNAEKPFYEVLQGQGRRRFSAYDVESGYYFPDRPLEAGHYWTNLAAFWALTDPEAYVLGSDADIGVYSINYYDLFDDEINKLVNALITENYKQISPVLELTDTEGENLKGDLHHQVLYQVWPDYYTKCETDTDCSEGYICDAGIKSCVEYIECSTNADCQTGFTCKENICALSRWVKINPETGQSIDDIMGPSQSGYAICEPCTANSDCSGYTGALGGIYCQEYSNEEGKFCLQDCTDDDSLCGSHEVCNDDKNCVPKEGTCVENVKDCSVDNPFGKCDTGKTCLNGVCEVLWPIVETDTTFSLVDDMIFYGMFYTTFGFNTRYNDQINVFKVGTNETITPGEGFETVSFTDPILGDVYGAIRENCDGGDTTGGSTGLCEVCATHDECAGYNGEYGGVWCQPLVDSNDEIWYCLVDCTDNSEICSEGTTCNDVGNCVPDNNACEDLVLECSEEAPLGHCEEGSTCVNGDCIKITELSTRCKYGLPSDTGGVQMVLRGKELAKRYNETLEAYYSDSSTDSEHELDLWRYYSRARYEMENHIEKINIIRAVYEIFGKVY